MAVGGGRATATEKIGHGGVLLYEIRRKRVGLSQCFLKGPENSTLSMSGEPDNRMRLEPCRRGGLWVSVGRRRQNSRRFVGIVAQLLRELP